MIGFFGSLEIETGMGVEEVSYAGFQFANSRDFVFFVLEEGEGKRWRKEKWSAFCLSKVEIWDLGSRFGFWYSFVKGKGSLRERERQSRDLKKFYYVFFFYKYYADVEICGSFKSFGFICIYRLNFGGYEILQ